VIKFGEVNVKHQANSKATTFGMADACALLSAFLVKQFIIIGQ